MARISPADQVLNYSAAKSARSPYENDYRLAAAYCLPAEYTSWQTDGIVMPQSQQAVRRTVFDSTGTRALPKYTAVLERLATPIGSKWQTLTASDAKLQAAPRVRAYMDTLTDLIFQMRYAPYAGFRKASTQMYGSIGTYGTGVVFQAVRKPNALSRTPGFMYQGVKFRDIFMLLNDNGEVDKVFRRFFLNCRQFRQKFPKQGYPGALAAEGQKPTPSETVYAEFAHVVEPRGDDYDPTMLDARRFPFVSSYLSVKDQAYVGDEEGFRSMPYRTPRVMTTPYDAYGHGPAIQVLANLGGLSQMKKTFLKQGNLAVDPVILAHDDGVLNGEVDLRPGHVNYGAMTKDGKKLIGTLDSGNFQIGVEMIQADQDDVNDAFFVSLFQLLLQAENAPQMTATQVIEIVAEKSALTSPTMGALQTEWLGPETERDIDMLDEMGRLPNMPPELIEAKGEYTLQYTSPLAKGMYADEISGYMRAVQFGIQVASETGDMSMMDNFEFDTSIPEIADKLGTPARWLATPDSVAAKRKQRADQQQQSEAVQNAAGLANAAQTAVNIRQPGVVPSGPSVP